MEVVSTTASQSPVPASPSPAAPGLEPTRRTSPSQERPPAAAPRNLRASSLRAPPPRRASGAGRGRPSAANPRPAADRARREEPRPRALRGARGRVAARARERVHAASAPTLSRHPHHTPPPKYCLQREWSERGAPGSLGSRRASFPGQRTWRALGAFEGSALQKWPLAEGELFCAQVGGSQHAGAPSQHVQPLQPYPNMHPRSRRCRGADPGAPGSGREVAALGGASRGGEGHAEGWAARRRSAVRRGAGDTPAASAPSPLVPGSVGRAVRGLPWARPLPLREEKAGEAPGARRLRRAAEPPARQALKTSPGGAPVRCACRRPCPERRPAPARSAPRAPSSGP